jgi:hypothetical protein
MVDAEASYHQVPLEGAGPQPVSREHGFKLGITLAVLGTSCAVLLCLMWLVGAPAAITTSSIPVGSAASMNLASSPNLLRAPAGHTRLMQQAAAEGVVVSRRDVLGNSVGALAGGLLFGPLWERIYGGAPAYTTGRATGADSLAVKDRARSAEPHSTLARARSWRR